MATLLHFNLQYVSCPSQPAYHCCFPDVGSDVTSEYLLPQRKGAKNVSVYLDYNLRPQVNIEDPAGHALLNDTQWFRSGNI